MCTLVLSHNAQAEFYVWVDESGVKHISMIPREGFNPDGTVKDEYNPNAFAYQYKRLPGYLNKIFRQNEKKKEAETIKWHFPPLLQIYLYYPVIVNTTFPAAKCCFIRPYKFEIIYIEFLVVNCNQFQICMV